jgi:stress response protein SCP2
LSSLTIKGNGDKPTIYIKGNDVDPIIEGCNISSKSMKNSKLTFTENTSIFVCSNANPTISSNNIRNSLNYGGK